jgi:hypothetical protein
MNLKYYSPKSDSRNEWVEMVCIKEHPYQYAMNMTNPDNEINFKVGKVYLVDTEVGFFITHKIKVHIEEYELSVWGEMDFFLSLEDYRNMQINKIVLP